MKEQLISFETAKLAKEKGFDWPTLYYHSTFNGERNPEDIKRGYTGSGIPASQWNKEVKNGMPEVELYSAPTQSLFQKWLREKHNIHVIPMINDTDGMADLKKGEYNYFYLVFFWHPDVISRGCVKNYYPPVHNPKHALFDSYEEALEKGLIEALKLIDNE